MTRLKNSRRSSKSWKMAPMSINQMKKKIAMMTMTLMRTLTREKHVKRKSELRILRHPSSQ